MLMSSRTTTGSVSRERVNAWDKCSVWIAAAVMLELLAGPKMVCKNVLTLS